MRIAVVVAAWLGVFCGQAVAEEVRHDVMVNGVRLAYWTSRPIRPDDVPIVYLHGGPGYNSYSFRKTIGATLGAKLPMVYLDERGSGASERSAAGGYTLATMAGDIEGLRKALGTARVVPMGHSFGAALAATYAQTYPEHTAAVILVDGAVDMPAAMATWVRTLKEGFPKLYAAEWNKAAGKALVAVDPKDTCALAKARLAFVGDALAEPADNEAFHHLQQFHNPKTLDEQTRIDKEGGFTNTGEAASALLSPSGGFLCYRANPASLTMPTLVLVGTYDRAVGVEAQRVLARQAPHATYVEFANSAHFPYEEEPGPFSAAVFSFLDSHGIDSPNSQPAPRR